MQQLLINQIWQHKSQEYRVLYFDIELDIFIWTRLEEEKTHFPEELSYESFAQLIDSEQVSFVNSQDQFANIDSIEEKSREKLTKNWDIIKDIVVQEPHIFDRKIFNGFCRDLAKANDISRHTVSRLIHRYWKNGKVKNGLVPKYYNSGGKGKEKSFTSKINGRKSEVNKEAIILDKKTKEKIARGYKRWYLKNQAASLNNAYINFIRKVFIQKGIDSYPSFAQFVYWGKKAISEEEKLIAKKGQIAYDKDFRIKEGSSYNSYNGPGLSQIDSTPGDIELVSDLDGVTPIGCPTIYTVADVFSGMILGITMSLENPSFAIASEALYYSFMDKGLFFKSTLLNNIEGFDLRSKDWPIEYIPHAIIADRGIELVSKNSNRLIENIGIEIENKESYRPELKGLIENTFKILHNDLKGIDNNIGYKLKDDGRRGAGKARKTRKLTMREYLAILVKTAIKFNNYRKLYNYPLDPEMFKDGLVDPTPLEVFNWGLKNRSGKLRSSNIANLREKMLPAEVGKLYKNWLEFKKGCYSMPLNQSLHDLRLKLQEKHKKVDVYYNPYNMNSIFFFHQGEVLECPLNVKRSPIYKDKTIWDINAFLKKKANSSASIDTEYMDATIEVNDFAESILSKKSKPKKGTSTSYKRIGKEREKNKVVNRKIKSQDQLKVDKERKEAKVVKFKKSRNLQAPDDFDLINEILNGE